MLTAAAVARQLGISARKVYDLHAEGANCASVSNFFPVMGRCYPAGTTTARSTASASATSASVMSRQAAAYGWIWRNPISGM